MEMTEEELRAICKGCREKYPNGDCREWHDRKLQRLNDRLVKAGGSCE